MRIAITLVIFSLVVSSAFAADTFVRPNIKTGLWEITETHTMTGMPAMPAIPPEALANMTPEQRAQMEEHMKSMGGGPKTTTRKDCVTKEKLDKDMAFDEKRPECTRTVISSSSSMTEMKIHCQEKDTTSDGTFKFEALSSESVKGTVRMVINSHGRPMNMNFDFISKYLGPSCGDVK
ncbi:MAG TPA: DUF3617 domain-containing protein [Terriglobales bacterium]|jgi:hypothetical protein|nr:DUF3617 domain-containing protein [Terriglobales bacterium]